MYAHRSSLHFSQRLNNFHEEIQLLRRISLDATVSVDWLRSTHMTWRLFGIASETICEIDRD